MAAAPPTFSNHATAFASSLSEHPIFWEVQHEVEKMHRALPGLTGILFLTREGGALGCSFSRLVDDPEAVIRTAATAANFGRLVSEGFECGHLTEMVMRGDLGDLFLYFAGDIGALVLYAAPESETASLNFEGRWVAQKLEELITRNRRIYQRKP